MAETDCYLLTTNNANAFMEEYAQIYDAVMADVPYASWLDYLMDIADEIGCQITSLLDAACGTGTFAMLVLQRGVNVIGVDSSPAMLARFKRKVKNHANELSCQIIESSLSTFEITKKADAAVCFFDSLNYVIREEEFASVLSQIATSLRSGGLFVFDVNNDVAYEQNLFQHSGQIVSGKGSCLNFEWLGHYCPDHSLYDLKLNFVAADTNVLQFSEQHIQRFYQRKTIQYHLEAAGFKSIRCFRAFSFEPGSPNDERWSFVAIRHR